MPREREPRASLEKARAFRDVLEVVLWHSIRWMTTQAMRSKGKVLPLHRPLLPFSRNLILLSSATMGRAPRTVFDFDHAAATIYRRKIRQVVRRCEPRCAIAKRC